MKQSKYSISPVKVIATISIAKVSNVEIDV